MPLKRVNALSGWLSMIASALCNKFRERLHEDNARIIHRARSKSALSIYLFIVLNFDTKTVTEPN
jgi:hypothetical protein